MARDFVDILKTENRLRLKAELETQREHERLARECPRMSWKDRESKIREFYLKRVNDLIAEAGLEPHRHSRPFRLSIRTSTR